MGVVYGIFLKAPNKKETSVLPDFWSVNHISFHEKIRENLSKPWDDDIELVYVL